MRFNFLRSLFCFLFIFPATALLADEVFRVGIIGTDTSHVPAFTKILNDPNAEDPCKGFKVVAAYPGGMPDNPGSWDRVQQYADGLKAGGVIIYPSIEAMLPHVDGILLESVDGRPHLEQAKPVIAAKKPLFIDKPMAGSLADVVAIFKLAQEQGVPVFSASSLRYSPAYQEARNQQPAGKTVGCASWGPCSLNDKHPDLYWYGIHGVEILFTIMGTGCKTVTRTQTAGTELVVGVWEDERIGTFRGIRKGKGGYGAVVFGEKNITLADTYAGYKPLVDEVCKFFKSGKSPIDPRETIEIFAFMSAADLSKQGGDKTALKISIDEIIKKAETEVPIYVQLKIAADETVTKDGKPVTLETLPAELNKLSEGKDNTQVKIILHSAKDTPIEFVREVCTKLGNAFLANYIYE
ncbi:MAG: Gfo/Idh/MocA family oxidoreductase [Planctomycetaceae bacterium]|nr:Gfo/Idh/MocA family oxidoreductase [Planctomycetaceae bacterium]